MLCLLCPNKMQVGSKSCVLIMSYQLLYLPQTVFFRTSQHSCMESISGKTVLYQYQSLEYCRKRAEHGWCQLYLIGEREAARNTLKGSAFERLSSFVQATIVFIEFAVVIRGECWQKNGLWGYEVPFYLQLEGYWRFAMSRWLWFWMFKHIVKIVDFEEKAKRNNKGNIVGTRNCGARSIENISNYGGRIERRKMRETIELITKEKCR